MRRRQRGARAPARPPTRLLRKRTQSETTPRPASPATTTTSARVWMDRNGFLEGVNGRRRSGPVPAVGTQRVDDEHHPKHFTVVNVGAGGRLYLRPSRVPGPNPIHAPATAPAISEAAPSSSPQHDERPSLQRSSEVSVLSGPWTPRLPLERSPAEKPNVSPAQPPIRMDHPHNRRKTGRRSQSCFPLSHRSHSKDDAKEFNTPHHENERPRCTRSSSADPSTGELGVSTPHYRLGTPRFSERGTACLHSSVTTIASVPSSVLSRAEYDKLFPVTPGGGISLNASASNGHLYLHPINAHRDSMSTIGTTPQSSGRPSTVGIVTPSTFDKIESNLDNPAIVHYHPTTGRIVAATPARLIAQVTSPDFLDYELLADFFLTFRCFMQCRDLLDYLFARLRWSFTSGNDAGRIVRVRTFVALRHWMLNYFADDFFMDGPFRQDFCTVVNELGAVLRSRSDRGGGDMNILVELKKCWMRTCALYWPVPEDLEVSPDADLTLGGVSRDNCPDAPPELSLPPLSILPTNARGSTPEMTTIPLPQKAEAPPPMARAIGATNRDTTSAVRPASIPVSPLSVESLEVLSCSVPFLRHLRPSARTRDRQKPDPRPAGAPPNSLNKKKTETPGLRPDRHHKRSGSFSDALRDKRTPLSTPKADNIELQDLPSLAITGGLARGLLLRPLSPTVDDKVPVTPGPELAEPRYLGLSDGGDRHQHNLHVKKFVGEVRRALGNRKGSSSRSPNRSTSGKGSAGSNSTVRYHALHRQRQPDWQQVPGPARLDILGQSIETAYKAAWEETFRGESEREKDHDRMSEPERAETPRPATAYKDKSLPTPPPIPESSRPSLEPGDFGPDTHDSRSIMVVDATGDPELPVMSGGLEGTSLSPMSVEMMPLPLFRDRANLDLPAGTIARNDTPEPPRTMAGEPKYHWRSSDARMHDFPAAPDRWSLKGRSSAGQSRAPSDSEQARESSGIGGMQPIRQLRRVPGGNLRDVNHVRFLETAAAPPRPRSEGSTASLVSAASRSPGIPSIPSTMSQDDGGVLPPDSSIDEAVNRTSVTLLANHSSQPVLRPSFESEARRLKGLPDEPDDLGGIEVALLKLEGKIASSWKSSSSGRSVDRSSDFKATETPETRITPDTQVAEAAAAEERAPPLLHAPAHQEVSVGDVRPMSGDIPMKISPSIKNDVRSPATEPQGVSIFRYPHAPWGNSSPPPDVPDDNRSLSDISTEIADGDEIGVRSFFFDDTGHGNHFPGQTFQPRYGTPTSTIPTTTTTTTETASPDRKQLLPRHNGYMGQQAGKTLKEKIGNPALQLQGSNQPFPTRPPDMRRSMASPGNAPTTTTTTFEKHIPFVLAFESEVIAEQLTIIEKDALDEVDWKDLISLNWQQRPPYVRNWVDFLNQESSTGIDMVIARFNMVVRWCISEIVLTEAASERARAITKYIHIASHCHRRRNYASLYQITLALRSTAISRLHGSWGLIALGEKHMLEQLEHLCRPLRNFHTLRAEMETAPPDDGLIPFIGLYTHDLTFNALKPARIDSPFAGTEPLVNFERYQMAAAIVKKVLRLIDASSRYTFRPQPEALSRCLWIAALEDDEIAARSIALEKDD